METSTMGRVLVTARIENLSDLFKVSEGTLAPEAVRTINVTDALVDTGATFLCLPQRYVGQLGLKRGRERRVRTAGGLIDISIYDAVRLTVQGRDCTVDVAAIADGVIVGSAIVKQIAAHREKPEMVKHVAEFVRSLKIAMRAAQPKTC